MAIYRNVHINFWEDSKVLDDMTIEERYFMLYLLTNPHSNQIGCFEISKKQMKNETGFNSEQINDLLRKFEKELHIIIYYNATKELYIKNWYKYNWSKSPKVRSCIEKEFLKIKSDELKGEIYKILVKIYGMDTLSIQYPKSMDSLGIKEEEEKEKEKEEEEEATKVATTPHFFNFNSVFEYGKAKGIDKSYCEKFYNYYSEKKKKWKSQKEWENKFNEWLKEDNIELGVNVLKKIDEGVFKL